MYGCIPRYVTFIITESCNLRCTYCYQHNKTDHKMSFETAKKCVDTLFKEDAENSKYINERDAYGIVLDFIGGEPLLEIDLIDQIVDYFLEKAISLNHRWANLFTISISTNGTLYNEKRVQNFLMKYRGRVSIGITIDGNKELHDKCRKFPDGSGSYDLAADAFVDVINNFGIFNTKLTIAPANLPYLYDAVVNMYDTFHISTIHANCVFEEGWELHHATEFYWLLKKIANWLLTNKRYLTHNFSLFNFSKYQPMNEKDNDNWCGGTGKMLAFGVDGTIYPCLRYAQYCVGPDVKPLVIGNVQHGIEKTDAEKSVCQELRSITRRSQSTDECFYCPVADGCSWCSAYCYEKNGTPNKRVTFICNMHRATSLANVYYWNKLMQLEEDTLEKWHMYLPEELAVPIIGQDEYDYLKKLSEGESSK